MDLTVVQSNFYHNQFFMLQSLQKGGSSKHQTLCPERFSRVGGGGEKVLDQQKTELNKWRRKGGINM
jgi:hypothetical protein